MAKRNVASCRERSPVSGLVHQPGLGIALLGKKLFIFSSPLPQEQSVRRATRAGVNSWGGSFARVCESEPRPCTSCEHSGCLQSLTCFGGCLCSEVCSKLLEHLSTFFLDEKPDEVRGCVELQRQRGREFALPPHHGGLQSFSESIDLAVLALPKERGQPLHYACA